MVSWGERGIGLCAEDCLTEAGASVVIDTLNRTDQLGTFDLVELLKDMELAFKQVKVVGSKLSIAEVSGENYRKAVAAGFSNFDRSSLTLHLLSY